MAVTGDDLAAFEGGPDILLDSLVRSVLTDLALHLAEPDEDFLVGKTMKGTSEAIESSGIGKEGV